MKKYLFIFSLLSTMVMAQETPILLFPNGAPGETTRLKQKEDLSGGHGYGLRNTGDLVNEWPFRVMSWLRDIKMVE